MVHLNSCINSSTVETTGNKRTHKQALSAPLPSSALPSSTSPYSCANDDQAAPASYPHKLLKASKNTGDWNTLSPATKKRYVNGVPSPDPIICEYTAAVSAENQQTIDIDLITKTLEVTFKK